MEGVNWKDATTRSFSSNSPWSRKYGSCQVSKLFIHSSNAEVKFCPPQLGKFTITPNHGAQDMRFRLRSCFGAQKLDQVWLGHHKLSWLRPSPFSLSQNKCESSRTPLQHPCLIWAPCRSPVGNAEKSGTKALCYREVLIGLQRNNSVLSSIPNKTQPLSMWPRATVTHAAMHLQKMPHIFFF